MNASGPRYDDLEKRAAEFEATHRQVVERGRELAAAQRQLATEFLAFSCKTRIILERSYLVLNRTNRTIAKASIIRDPQWSPRQSEREDKL